MFGVYVSPSVAVISEFDLSGSPTMVTDLNVGEISGSHVGESCMLRRVVSYK
jgi:hypothetical protein